MILPYSHRSAMIQAPVLYEIGPHKLLIYPLTLGAQLLIDNKALEIYMRNKSNGVDLLPPELKVEFIHNILKESDKFSLSTEEGMEITKTSVEFHTFYISQLTRNTPPWTEEHIRSTFYPTGEVIQAMCDQLACMKSAVTRALPRQPELHIVKKEPRYEMTKEEREAQPFCLLAEKYHWGYEYVMNLTEYQCHWYSHLYPSEREHIEDMDAMANKNKSTSFSPHGTRLWNPPRTDLPPKKSSVIHFDTAEEYEAWKAGLEQDK